MEYNRKVVDPFPFSNESIGTFQPNPMDWVEVESLYSTTEDFRIGVEVEGDVAEIEPYYRVKWQNMVGDVVAIGIEKKYLLPSGVAISSFPVEVRFEGAFHDGNDGACDTKIAGRSYNTNRKTVFRHHTIDPDKIIWENHHTDSCRKWYSLSIYGTLLLPITQESSEAGVLLECWNLDGDIYHVDPYTGNIIDVEPESPYYGCVIGSSKGRVHKNAENGIPDLVNPINQSTLPCQVTQTTANDSATTEYYDNSTSPSLEISSHSYDGEDIKHDIGTSPETSKTTGTSHSISELVSILDMLSRPTDWNEELCDLRTSLLTKTLSSLIKLL